MKKRERLVIILIILAFIAGIAIKMYYVHYTDVWERQHDVIGFGESEGQAAYIEYFLNNHSIPDFDPRSKWGFFQPPLHHIISAVMIAISSKLGMNYGRATENVQYLTCFYMIMVMIIMIIIFLKASRKINYFNKTTSGLYVALCVAGVHPIFTILSGSINNDALSLVLAALALLFTLLWYDNPTLLKIIHIGFAIGLSMMAKLTGGLIAVPIGIIFLMKLAKIINVIKREKKGEYVSVYDELGMNSPFIKNGSDAISNAWLQMFVFFAAVVPTGLWWTVRNMIKWGMPVNYIPPVGEQFPETVTKLQRLFDLRMNSVYCALINSGADYDEYSIPLALIKTSLFGEWDFSQVSGKIRYFAWPLFILGVVLLLLSLVATFYMTFSKKSYLKIQYKVALFGTWITYLLAYLSFAFTSNNFSAQDFRYGAICIMVEGIFLGLFTDEIKSIVFKHVIIVSASLFAACSVMVYFIIGFKS